MDLLRTRSFDILFTSGAGLWDNDLKFLLSIRWHLGSKLKIYLSCDYSRWAAVELDSERRM